MRHFESSHVSTVMNACRPGVESRGPRLTDWGHPRLRLSAAPGRLARTERAAVDRDRRFSSNSIARRLSAGWLQTAPFVAEQQSRPARLLVVRSERPHHLSGDD